MAMMADKYNAKESKKSLYMLKKMYDKTFLDPRFQRYGGVNYGSGWDFANARKYIGNFFAGGTFNSVIVVSVSDALRYATEVGCQKSIEYFKEIQNKGYEYISVDGNNSASFLTAYISGNKDLGKIEHENYANSVMFEELSEEDQEEVQHVEKIQVIVLRDITVDEMCELFRNLNTATKLLPQEHRQARLSSLADAVRNYGDSLRVFFQYMIFSNTDNLDKRFHEELLAVLALKIEKDYGVGQAKKRELDNFYDTAAELSKKTIASINKIVSTCKNIQESLEKPLSKKLTKGQIQNLFDLIHIVENEDNISIKDAKGFYSWFLEKDTEFLNASKSVVSEEEENKSYKYWTKYYAKNQNWSKIRGLFRYALGLDLEDLVDNGVLEIRRSSKDRFSFAQKLSLYMKQNKKTRNGDKIGIIDLYMGEYEADHVKSIKDGGKTEISNAELMKVSENRSKGAKSNEPFFPHQELVCQ
jgi:hypothetical protein